MAVLNNFMSLLVRKQLSFRLTNIKFQSLRQSFYLLIVRQSGNITEIKHTLILKVIVLLRRSPSATRKMRVSAIQTWHQELYLSIFISIPFNTLKFIDGRGQVHDDR